MALRHLFSHLIPPVRNTIEVSSLEHRILQAMATVMAKPSFMMASRRDPKWSKESAKFREAHPMCVGCGTRKLLQVHHKKPFHLHPELEMDPDNWIVLCENPTWFCHFHLGHCGDWTAYNPHVVEDAARQLDRINRRVYGS